MPTKTKKRKSAAKDQSAATKPKTALEALRDCEKKFGGNNLPLSAKEVLGRAPLYEEQHIAMVQTRHWGRDDDYLVLEVQVFEDHFYAGEEVDVIVQKRRLPQRQLSNLLNVNPDDFDL